MKVNIQLRSFPVSLLPCSNDDKYDSSNGINDQELNKGFTRGISSKEDCDKENPENVSHRLGTSF